VLRKAKRGGTYVAHLGHGAAVLTSRTRRRRRPTNVVAVVVTRHSLGSFDASSPAVPRAAVLQAQKRRLGGLRLSTTRALGRRRRRRRVLCDDVTTICHYSAEILPLFNLFSLLLCQYSTTILPLLHIFLPFNHPILPHRLLLLCRYSTLIHPVYRNSVSILPLFYLVWPISTTVLPRSATVLVLF